MAFYSKRVFTQISRYFHRSLVPSAFYFLPYASSHDDVSCASVVLSDDNWSWWMVKADNFVLEYYYLKFQRLNLY